jgi:hypothetical protein
VTRAGADTARRIAADTSAGASSRLPVRISRSRLSASAPL